MDSLTAVAYEALLYRRAAIERGAPPERSEVEDIEAALDRIASGSWGVCQCCGHAIGRLRLRAAPAVRTCIPCEEGAQP